MSAARFGGPMTPRRGVASHSGGLCGSHGGQGDAGGAEALRGAEYHAWAAALLERLQAEAQARGWTWTGGRVESGSYYTRFTPSAAVPEPERTAAAFTVRVSNHKPHGVRAKFNFLPGLRGHRWQAFVARLDSAGVPPGAARAGGETGCSRKDVAMETTPQDDAMKPTVEPFEVQADGKTLVCATYTFTRPVLRIRAVNNTHQPVPLAGGMCTPSYDGRHDAIIAPSYRDKPVTVDLRTPGRPGGVCCVSATFPTAVDVDRFELRAVEFAPRTETAAERAAREADFVNATIESRRP